MRGAIKPPTRELMPAKLPEGSAEAFPGARVLIVASSPDGRQAFASVLADLGVEPAMASSLVEARRLLGQQEFTLVFCESALADGTAESLLEQLRAAKCEVLVVVFSRLTGMNEYLRAMRLGAFDFITPPYRRSDIAHLILLACRPGRVTAATLRAAASGGN